MNSNNELTEKPDLPYANIVLILAIMSVVSCMLLAPIVIFGFGETRRLYRTEPQNFSEKSIKKYKNGILVAKVSLSLFVLLFVLYVLLVVAGILLEERGDY